MKKLFCLLFVSGVMGCAEYQEPKANCFSFVSRGPAPIDCNFEALGLSDLEDIANE